MKEEHAIKNIAFVDDGYEKTLQDEEKRDLNKHLPLDKRQVLPENESNIPRNRSNHVRLYKCSENSGKYRVAEIKNVALNQTDLDPNVNNARLL